MELTLERDQLHTDLESLKTQLHESETLVSSERQVYLKKVGVLQDQLHEEQRSSKEAVSKLKEVSWEVLSLYICGNKWLTHRERYLRSSGSVTHTRLRSLFIDKQNWLNCYFEYTLFYKNKLYKNKLRTITRLKFQSCSQIEMTSLVRISRVIGGWKSDK